MPQTFTRQDIARMSIPVFIKHDVCRAGLFGSFARGEERQGSDLDFLVEFRAPVSLFALGELKDDLEELFKTPCDVLTFASVWRDTGPLSQRIREEAQAIYGY